MQIIFPYYSGKVSSGCNSTNFDATDVTAVGTCKCSILSNSGIFGQFCTGDLDKGFLAVPKSAGNQTTNTFTKASVGSNEYIIGGDLWGNPFDVGSVTVNGVNNTYSVYLFNYGSSSSSIFQFTT